MLSSFKSMFRKQQKMASMLLKLYVLPQVHMSDPRYFNIGRTNENILEKTMEFFHTLTECNNWTCM